MMILDSALLFGPPYIWVESWISVRLLL